VIKKPLRTKKILTPKPPFPKKKKDTGLLTKADPAKCGDKVSQNV
jgi:hypothetical protein